MLDFVIQAVEKMAEDQGIKSLKLFKNKQPLFPNDWTAGVDYETTNDKNILDEEGNYHEVDLDYEQQIHHAVDKYEYMMKSCLTNRNMNEWIKMKLMT